MRADPERNSALKPDGLLNINLFRFIMSIPLMLAFSFALTIMLDLIFEIKLQSFD